MVALKALVSLCAFVAVPVFAWGHDHCIDDDTAADLVDTFEYFFVNIDPKLANQTLTKDFTVYSAAQLSVTPNNTLAADAAIYKNRADFVASQPTGNPSAANFFNTLDVFNSCDKIAFRWTANFPGVTKTVYGIDTLDVVKVHGDWKIKADYSEWDTVAFLEGVGVCNLCS